MAKDKHSKEEQIQMALNFEKDKIKSLNKFFMRGIVHGLIFAFLLFMLTVVLLLITMMATDMDESVKITIISMVATFVLTSSKTLMDRTIEIVTFGVRILGEEQRGFAKKIGVEMDEVEFIDFSEDDEKKQS